MKYNLITLAILLNITFLVYGKSPSRRRRHPSSTLAPNIRINTDNGIMYTIPDVTEQQPDNPEYTTTESPYDNRRTPEDPDDNGTTTEGPEDSETTTEDPDDDSTATEDPDDNSTTTEDPDDNETTTENAYTSTTSKSNNVERDCPKDQSSFSKDDLFKIVRYISDVQFNILPNISDAYHDVAINARDELLQEFKDFITKFKDRPEHLFDVLDDMKDTRETKIAPLVNKTADTLQNFPAVEDMFNMLDTTATNLLNNLEKYKKICELNNCNHEFRNSFPLRSGFIVSQPDDADYMCTTIDKVHSTVQERLKSFEQKEIERITSYVTGQNDILNHGIANLKQRLREAAVSQFGTTMYDILTLNDDYFHFMKSLIDFNSKSYPRALKKSISNIQYKLVDLDEKVHEYRQRCLTCNKVRRRRNIEMESEINVAVVVETETILDEIIGDKIAEITKVVQANVNHIFQELTSIVNDNDYVDKSIAALKPIQEAVSTRAKVEREALESLMKSVQKESREHVQDLELKAEKLLRSIEDALNFLQN